MSNLLWAAGASIVALPFAYRAALRVAMDWHKFQTIRQRDEILLGKLKQQKDLAGIRVIQPTETGHLGTAFDGATYRNLDTLSVITQTIDRRINPLAQRMAHIERLMLAQRARTYHADQDDGAEIEEPVQWPESVSLLDCFRDGSPSLHNLLIGRTYTADGYEDVCASLEDMMHTLEVGASGWGKSVWMRSLLWQLAMCPEPVRVVAIDINGSEFNVLRNWSKLLYPVARTTEDAIIALGEVSREVGHRADLYSKTTATSLSEYNRGREYLDPWVIPIDEGTNLLNQKGIGEPLRKVVQTGRQYGIYVLLAGQSAGYNVVQTQVRDNFSTRICFRTSPTSSRVVLDDPRAFNLRSKGRAWVMRPGQELVEIQGPYIDRDSFVNALGGDGPKYQMPIVNLTTKEQQVLDLHDEGKSDTGIAREVYGHGTTFYIDKVREILTT
jgi:hypothetical protein